MKTILKVNSMSLRMVMIQLYYKLHTHTILVQRSVLKFLFSVGFSIGSASTTTPDLFMLVDM